MRVYIAGPMTGYPGNNHAAFRAEEKRLQRYGRFKVINPIQIELRHGFNREYRFYLSAAIQMLLTCNAVSVLPGWELSTGASAEVTVAKALGIPVYPAGVLKAQGLSGEASPEKDTPINIPRLIATGQYQPAYSRGTCQRCHERVMSDKGYHYAGSAVRHDTCPGEEEMD